MGVDSAKKNLSLELLVQKDPECALGERRRGAQPETVAVLLHLLCDPGLVLRGVNLVQNPPSRERGSGCVDVLLSVGLVTQAGGGQHSQLWSPWGGLLGQGEWASSPKDRCSQALLLLTPCYPKENCLQHCFTGTPTPSSEETH